MKNSNTSIRMSARLKAIVLILIPMLFAAMGSTLIEKVDAVDANRITLLEAELKTIKKEKAYFVHHMNKVDSIWLSYRKLQKKSLKMEDALDAGQLNGKLSEKEKAMNKLFNRIEKSLKDTVFNAVYIRHIKNYKTKVNNFKEWAKDKKTIRSFDTEAEPEDKDDKVEKLRDKIDRLESKNLRLKEKYLDCISNKTDCSSVKRELQKMANQSGDSKHEFSRLQDKYESLKDEKVYLINGYNRLFLKTKSSLDDLEVNGLCKKKGFKKEKEKIINAIDQGVLELQKP